MKYHIPNEVIDWNSLSDKEFLKRFNPIGREDLRNSYLFYNDIPLELAGCKSIRNWQYELEKVFKHNEELGVTIPTSKIWCMYSLAGIQHQFNETVRMQYYYPSEMCSNTIGCFAYYHKCYLDEDNTIKREIINLPLMLDRAWVHKENLIDDLCEKVKDVPEGPAFVHWVVASYTSDQPKSRMIMFNFLSTKLQERYNRIKGVIR